MKQSSALRRPWAAYIVVCLLVLSAGMNRLQSQTSAGSIQGSLVDPGGHAVQGAVVAVVTDVALVKKVTTGADGKYSVDGLAAGTYTVEFSAPGFSTVIRHGVTVTSGMTASLPVTLSIASVSQEVTVEAEADNSLAAQLSPVKSVLDAASARTEITSNYVTEFTSPVTDFADIVTAAPGTVSWNSNGVGLGQAKIYFRGFKDDDYTVTWDGIPFSDSNDPSHHSWAYVPAPAIGYVDFDRSPGTASDMGPANYGGSIHFFSPRLPDTPSAQFSESYGSFNTNSVLGQYYSGLFLHDKGNFWFEGNHMSSDGYQTFNYQVRTAGTAKLNYKFSDKTNLALVGTVVLADANTPNNDAYRFQLTGNQTDTGTDFVFANALLQNNQHNADGSLNGLYYKYYTYHVPTNFEVITFTKDFAHGWRLETKPYTYSYSNHQHYNNNQYSEVTPALNTMGLNTAPVVACTGSDLTNASNAKACYTAIDKMNQYNRAGNITEISAASKWGVFRTGAWYEYTYTNRYQIGTDPTTWIDTDVIKYISFHEHFITRAVQPFGEYQLVAIPRMTITAGLKDAYYNMTLTQYASNKKVGPLGCPTSDTTAQCPNSVIHEAGYNSWLPSFEANLRLLNNWSVYGQYGKGSIIPFSAVYDVTGAQVQATPPPTIATTYQGGTVYKANNFTMDADAYHIHFVNQYSSYTYTSGPNNGLTYYYATPPSDTDGLEGEGNIAFTKSISLFLNGTLGKAMYEASNGTVPTTQNPNGTPASTSAWVALAPHDTEEVALSYQSKGWDLGMFNQRVGSRWEDDGSTHQNIPLPAWWMSNLFLNYTVRNGSRFDNSKIKLSFNNLFNNNSIADVTGAGNITPAGVGTAPTVNGQLYTPSPLDSIQLLPGRSVMITFQLGFSPKER